MVVLPQLRRMDQIFIKGLKLNTIVGILEHERIYPQPLILDIVLEHDLKACAQSGNLELSINYAQVCESVTQFIQEHPAYLLETLAEDVCQFILSTFKPSAVTLSISKPNAVLNVDGVGVKITRKQGDM